MRVQEGGGGREAHNNQARDNNATHRHIHRRTKGCCVFPGKQKYR